MNTARKESNLDDGQEPLLTDKEKILYRKGLKILFKEMGFEFLHFIKILIKVNKANSNQE